jgi:cytochrome oxidase Cu insertion factor (SCO1/SenC/PrrC family)
MNRIDESSDRHLDRHLDGNNEKGDNMLAVGSAAPDFSAKDQNGQTVSLSGLKGKWIALWWYPKASTPG